MRGRLRECFPFALHWKCIIDGSLTDYHRPHTLPASAIAAAHLAPLLAFQQSQCNAKLQTMQSQNATLARTIEAQRAEMDELLKGLEAVVEDLDGANFLLEKDEEERVKGAIDAEKLMGGV